MRTEKIKNFLKDKYFEEVVYPRREKILLRWKKKEIYSFDLPLIESLMKERFIRGIGIFKKFEIVSEANPPSHNYLMYHSSDIIKMKFDRSVPEVLLSVLRHHIAGESCGSHCHKIRVSGNVASLPMRN